MNFEEQEQKEILKILVYQANKIQKREKTKANHVLVSEDFIQRLANQQKISFANMVGVIGEILKDKNR